MKRKGLFPLVVALLVVVIAAAVWARAYVIGASDFSSNGAPIAGWHWLRSPGNTATWTFSARDLQGPRGVRVVYINLNPLVTNGVNGGAGYDTTCSFTVSGFGSYSGTIGVVNPFRPQDPDNSGGVGYQCYGHSGEIPARVYKGVHEVKVTISYPFPNGRHMAVNRDCMSIGYRK